MDAVRPLGNLTRPAATLSKRRGSQEFLGSPHYPGEDGGYDLARHFGLQSGREIDKWAGVPHRLAANGCPVLEQCVGFLELSLIPGPELDAGGHTVFLAEIRNGGAVGTGKALTYQRYQEIKGGLFIIASNCSGVGHRDTETKK